jgi:hypothetical protein
VFVRSHAAAAFLHGRTSSVQARDRWSNGDRSHG